MKVAVLFPSKKLKKHHFRVITEYLSTNHDLSVCNLLSHTDIDALESDYDLIIHKYTEPLFFSCIGDKTALKVVNSIDKFVSKQKNARIVGGHDFLSVLVSRSMLYNWCLSNNVHMPETIALDIENTKSAIDLLSRSGGCIIKPLIACGSKPAHQMFCYSTADELGRILASEEFTNHVLKDWIVQVFHHTSVFFKIYFFFNNVYIKVKEQFPFNCYNTQDHSANDSSAFSLSEEIKCHLEALCTRLNNLSAMDVFGIDVILVDGQFLLVDFNYFPSFKHVKNFSNVFLEYLKL
ncbi:hypothetical protein PCE1_004152 [Barthelona sp. PCE]